MRPVSASRIPVHCSFTRIAPLSQLKPNPRNPNQHPDRQIRILAKIIKEQGWRAPIVVSNRSGLVVKGHARIQAAKVLGVDEVPVDLQDYESEASELADMIADNRIAELGEINMPHLKDLLIEMDTGAFDARGAHAIDGMGNIVFEMLDNGWQDEEICNNLGLEPDEILKLKHITGFSALFKNIEYSRAWETKRMARIRLQAEKNGERTPYGQREKQNP